MIQGVAQPTLATANVTVEDGAPGASAYAIAYQHDHTIGTEQQWLASLKGNPGETPTITLSSTSGTDGNYSLNGYDMTVGTSDPNNQATISVCVGTDTNNQKHHILKLGTNTIQLNEGNDGTVFELYRVLLYGQNAPSAYQVTGSDNPKKLGLLEVIGGEYMPTSDTIVDANKTYYSYGAITTILTNGLYGLYDNVDSKSRVYKYNPVSKLYSTYSVSDSNGTHPGTIADLNRLISVAADNNKGGYIVDICPDTEDPYQIAWAMQNGLYGRWHKNGEGAEGAVSTSYEGLNIMCCKEVGSRQADTVLMVAFTVKVYKNVQ